jgi:hypothetical protein
VGRAVEECTGTVVAPRLILTAAHCAEDTATRQPLDPSGYRVVTGSVNRNARDRQISGVSRVIVYPGFDPATLDHDAALLVLARPTSAPTMTLATAESSAAVQPGATAVIAGWGLMRYGEITPVRHLQTANTVPQSAEYCEERLGARFDRAGEICAIDPQRFDSGGCEGDSGGPLITAGGPLSGAVEIGIFSSGYKRCSTRVPGVYTRVDTLSSWVRATGEAAGSHGAASPSTVTDFPGFYGGRSPRYRIFLHVARDGRHVDGLQVKTRLSCPRGGPAPLDIVADVSWPIRDRVLRAGTEVAGSGSLRPTRIRLYVRFDELGEAEGTLSAQQSSRDHRAVCRLDGLRFWAVF